MDLEYGANDFFNLRLSQVSIPYKDNILIESSLIECHNPHLIKYFTHKHKR